MHYYQLWSIWRVFVFLFCCKVSSRPWFIHDPWNKRHMHSCISIWITVLYLNKAAHDESDTRKFVETEDSIECFAWKEFNQNCFQRQHYRIQITVNQNLQTQYVDDYRTGICLLCMNWANIHCRQVKMYTLRSNYRNNDVMSRAFPTITADPN